MYAIYKKIDVTRDNCNKWNKTISERQISYIFSYCGWQILLWLHKIIDENMTWKLKWDNLLNKGGQGWG